MPEAEIEMTPEKKNKNPKTSTAVSKSNQGCSDGVQEESVLRALLLIKGRAGTLRSIPDRDRVPWSSPSDP